MGQKNRVRDRPREREMEQRDEDREKERNKARGQRNRRVPVAFSRTETFETSVFTSTGAET